MAVKLGEFQAEMTSDVKKTEDWMVLLGVDWTDKSTKVSFKPSEDINRCDKIKITIEKV